MARRQHGPLSIEEISLGLGACIDNLSALAADAEVLIQAGRPTRALTCLLVAGQEIGKIQLLNAMLTFNNDDSDRWKRIWKSFYSHKDKAAGGLLGLMDPHTSTEEIGHLVVLLNAVIGGTAEEERNRTLYVDFDDRSRSWSSPISGGPELASTLMPLTKQALDRLLSSRKVGLHSPKALTIIREVWASVPILDTPDPNDPADPAIAAKYYQESLARNEIIRQRLTAEGFDMS